MTTRELWILALGVNLGTLYMLAVHFGTRWVVERRDRATVGQAPMVDDGKAARP
jgi:hypothetical protein